MNTHMVSKDVAANKHALDKEFRAPIAKNGLGDSVSLALKNVAQEWDTGLIEDLKPVLERNVNSRRLASFLRLHGSSIEGYIERIAENYQAQASYIRALQLERDESLWKALYAKLAKWSYAYLLRKNFHSGDETMELAKELTSQASIQILNTPFPYDVDFELWSHRLLINVCAKHLRTEGRRSRNLPGLNKSIDDLSEVLSDGGRVENQINRVEVGQALIDGVAKLSPARAEVVRRYYFEEMSFAEIAVNMGKSVGAVHGLHFHALQSLRDHLDETGFIDE